MSTDVPMPQQEHEPAPDYIIIHGHSNTFYWWPVWFTAFLMAGLTFMEGSRMAVVPSNAPAPVAPAADPLPADPQTAPVPPAGVLVSRSNNLGVVFVTVLALVAVVSTVTLRGLVSVIVIISLIALVVILALLNLWDDIFAFLGGVAIRINAAGYLAVAIPLFLIWAVVTFVYDHQRYVIFDQGQIRLRLEVGDAERVMDANGAVVEKLRDDVFRHWLFGLGAGDLRVRTSGSNGREFEIDNVLFIGRKLGTIQRMLMERQVTAAVAGPTLGAAS